MINYENLLLEHILEKIKKLDYRFEKMIRNTRFEITNKKKILYAGIQLINTNKYICYVQPLQYFTSMSILKFAIIHELCHFIFHKKIKKLNEIEQEIWINKHIKKKYGLKIPKLFLK